MCQDLPLGCLNCLFGMCSTKTDTFAIVHEFTYFTGKHTQFMKFLHSTDMQIFHFSYFFIIFLVTEVYGPFASLQIVPVSQIAVLVSFLRTIEILLSPVDLETIQL